MTADPDAAPETARATTRRKVSFSPHHVKTQCRPCTGSGSVPVDPHNARKGNQRCPNCDGEGEV